MTRWPLTTGQIALLRAAQLEAAAVPAAERAKWDRGVRRMRLTWIAQGLLRRGSKPMLAIAALATLVATAPPAVWFGALLLILVACSAVSLLRRTRRAPISSRRRA